MNHGVAGDKNFPPAVVVVFIYTPTSKVAIELMSCMQPLIDFDFSGQHQQHRRPWPQTACAFSYVGGRRMI
jgi:hypothetical protein